MPGTQSQETKLALMEQAIQTLKEHQEEQDRLIADMKADRDKALLWGIAALGTMVLSMGAFIVNFAKDHWK